MAKISKSLVVPYTAQQMYDLVNAVETYPDFLPWCTAVQVHNCSDSTLHATICLSKGPATYSITTNNTMIQNNRIDMQYIAGPFKSCNGSWQFLQQGNSCNVLFDMHYEFKNKITGVLLEPVFGPISNTLIDAFSARAEQIYG